MVELVDHAEEWIDSIASSPDRTFLTTEPEKKKITSVVFYRMQVIPVTTF